MEELTSKIDLITPSERERQQIETARKIFADYGLHPENYSRLDEELRRIEEDKSREISFNCGPRTCLVCGKEYLGGNEICGRCYDVYEGESLFWRQGKIIDNRN